MSTTNYDKEFLKKLFSSFYSKIESNFATKLELQDILTVVSALQAAGATNIDLSDGPSNSFITAAAAEVIKSIDLQELRGRISQIRFVDTVDTLGRPIVPHVNYSTIYLTPGAPGNDYVVWNEYIAVKTAVTKVNKSGYKWELIGSTRVDLRWVRDSINVLNNKMSSVLNTVNTLSDSTAEALLEKAIKPLAALREYIQSDEYLASIASGVVDNIPDATEENTGLMTADQVVSLNGVCEWASAEYGDGGGGALGESYVQELWDSCIGSNSNSDE